MDKNTLSQYGWVIIVIIVLAIMISLATPFGGFVKESVLNATDSFGQKVVGSLDAAGVDVQKGPDTSNITTETSDNVMMSFVDMDAQTISDKAFLNWIPYVQKVKFAQSYNDGLTPVDDPNLITSIDENATSGNVLDISEAGDGSVVAYITMDGEAQVLNIAGKDGVVMANPNSLGLFYSLWLVKEIDFNKSFNTSLAENMQLMFGACGTLTNLNLSEFDTSNVVDMSGMFGGCDVVETINLSSFNTANVKDMSYMFDDCSMLPDIDLSHFDTSSVTNMGAMFDCCWNIVNLDLSNFDTSNVTNMEHMFYNCKKINSLNLSNFNTANVENMSYMFSYCVGLVELDLSSFNTLKVTDMKGMFCDCKNLTTLDISSFNTPNVENMFEMFEFCQKLEAVDVSSFDTSKVTDMSNMFEFCQALKELDLSSFDTSSVTASNAMFSQASGLEHIYVSDGWTLYNPDVNYMFYGCGVSAVEKKTA